MDTLAIEFGKIAAVGMGLTGGIILLGWLFSLGGPMGPER